MDTIQSVFVTGVTGHQGGSVARHLAQNGIRVYGLTRDTSSPAARSISHPLIEIVKGDLDAPSTYRPYLEKADAVFCVLPMSNKADNEMMRGKLMVDTAAGHPVKHFIYSSVVGADRHTGIPHWESKYQIENHLRNSGLPFTIVRPSSFYENFLIPQVLSRIQKGKLVTPVKGNVPHNFMSATDVGKVIQPILKNTDQYAGETVSLAAEEMNHIDVASVFSKVLGKEIKYATIPSLLTRLIMGKGLHIMFSWVNENGCVFVNDLDGFRLKFPGFIRIEDWAREHLVPGAS
jgi:uncharacterized protein YbjT (DUF2867 family)